MENSIEINEEEKSIQKMKEGVDSCDEHEEHKHEMKGPSMFNNNDISKMLNPDMIKKIQNSPKFMEMIKKQEEENKIKSMSFREKLRARLRQKQKNRMSTRNKEAQSEENEKSTKNKRTKKVKKPPVITD